MWRLICDFIENRQGVRRLLLLWAVVIVSWCLVKFWDHIDKITQAHASVLVAVIGLVGVVTGFYITGRNR